MGKPEVVQLPGGEWAVVVSTHANKGAADKAANDGIKSEKTFKISLTEKQVQVLLNALIKE